MTTALRVFDLPGWTGLKISGRVDAFNDRQMIQSIEMSVRDSLHVVLDLSEADFLSLQMLKYLIGLNQNLGRNGGQLALLRPTHNVRRQIEIFVGVKVFAVYRSFEELHSGFYAQPRAEFHSATSERTLS